MLQDPGNRARCHIGRGTRRRQHLIVVKIHNNNCVESLGRDPFQHVEVDGFLFAYDAVPAVYVYESLPASTSSRNTVSSRLPRTCQK